MVEEAIGLANIAAFVFRLVAKEVEYKGGKVMILDNIYYTHTCIYGIRNGNLCSCVGLVSRQLMNPTI